MNNFASTVFGFFSLQCLVAFFAGCAITYIILKWDEHIKHKRNPNWGHLTLRPLVFLWSIIFLMIAYIGVQEEQQAIAVHSLARDTEQCNKEFHEALIKRDNLKQEADDLASQERQALAAWLTAMVIPPPNIAALHTTDPGFQEYAVQKTKEFYEQEQSIELSRQRSLMELSRHPLPEPQCGKR